MTDEQQQQQQQLQQQLSSNNPLVANATATGTGTAFGGELSPQEGGGQQTAYGGNNSNVLVVKSNHDRSSSSSSSSAALDSSSSGVSTTTTTSTTVIAVQQQQQDNPSSPSSSPLHPSPSQSTTSTTSTSSTNTTGTRCLIVQKDEKGFGLRVSGDNPVFVESVRPDGAAWRAGVRPGDRIIKVNGTLVTKQSHQDVVRLIMAGGQARMVSLHLLGRPPSSSSCGASSGSGSGSTTSTVVTALGQTVSSSTGETTSDNLLLPLDQQQSQPGGQQWDGSEYSTETLVGSQVAASQGQSSSSSPQVVSNNSSCSSTNNVMQRMDNNLSFDQLNGNHNSLLLLNHPSSQQQQQSNNHIIMTNNQMNNQNQNLSNTTTNSTTGGQQQQQLITAPLPANWSTLLEFEKHKEKTIKAMIKRENQHLKQIVQSLQSSSSNNSNSGQHSDASSQHNEQDQRQTLQRISHLKQQLHFLKRARTKQHLSQSSSASATSLMSPFFGVAGQMQSSSSAAAADLRHQQGDSSGSSSKSSKGGIGSKWHQDKSSKSAKAAKKSRSFTSGSGSGGGAGESTSLLQQPIILAMESDEDDEEDNDDDYDHDHDPNDDHHHHHHHDHEDADNYNDNQDSKDHFFLDHQQHPNWQQEVGPALPELPLHSLEDVLRGGRHLFLRLVAFGNSLVSATSCSSSSSSAAAASGPSAAVGGGSGRGIEADDALSPLLFLLLARTFASSGSGSSGSSGVLRKDWLFELHSLFLLPDSPLRLSDQFKEADLNRVYDALNSLTMTSSSSTTSGLLTSSSSQSNSKNSSSGQGATTAAATGQSSPSSSEGSLLEPFVEVARRQLDACLLGRWNKHIQLGMMNSGALVGANLSLTSLLNGAFSASGTGGAGGSASASAADQSVCGPFNASTPLAHTLLQLVQGGAYGAGGVASGGRLAPREQDLLPLSKALARVLSLLSVSAQLGLVPRDQLTSLAPFLLFSRQSSSNSASGAPGGGSGGVLVKRHKSLPNSSSVVGSTCSTSGHNRGAAQNISGGGGGGKGSSDPHEGRVLAALLSPGNNNGAASPGAAGHHHQTGTTTIVLQRQGHLFQAPSLFPALSSVAYCSACLHLLWGKPNLSLQCSQCLLLSHSWCFFLSQQSPQLTQCPIVFKTTSAALGGQVLPPALLAPHVVAKKHNRVTSFVFDNLLPGALGSDKKGQKAAAAAAAAAATLAANNALQSNAVLDSATFAGQQHLALIGQQLGAGQLHIPPMSSSSESEDETSVLDDSFSLLDEDLSEADEQHQNQSNMIGGSEDGRRPLSPTSSNVAVQTTLVQQQQQYNGGGGVLASNQQWAEQRGSQSPTSAGLSQEERRQKRRKASRQRRDILRELLRTEKSHVRNLQLLDILFYTPCRQEALLSPDELGVLFANHAQLLRLHSDIHSQLKRIVRPVLKRASSLGVASISSCNTIGQQQTMAHQSSSSVESSSAQQPSSVATYRELAKSLCLLFEGPLGTSLGQEAAAFCCRQSAAHDLLRQKQSRSYKFLTFLSEAESHSALKRLRLKDLLAACFQRVTKYPLLVQSLLKTFQTTSTTSSNLLNQQQQQDSSSSSSAAVDGQSSSLNGSSPLSLRNEERQWLQKALDATRRILSDVNSRVRQEECRAKLAFLQKRVTIAYEPLPELVLKSDWATSLELVHEGPLSWRITKQKLVEVHALLTAQFLIVLTKEGVSSSSSSSSSSTDHHHHHHSSDHAHHLMSPTSSASSGGVSSFASSSGGHTSGGGGSTGGGGGLGGGGGGVSGGLGNVSYVIKGHLNPINRSTYAPVLSVRRLLTRNVATDKTAFFLVQPEEHSIYEFVALSSQERKTWTDAIQRLVDRLDSSAAAAASAASSSGKVGGATVATKSQAPPPVVRVEGAIRVVTPEDEHNLSAAGQGKLLDFREHVTVTTSGLNQHQQHHSCNSSVNNVNNNQQQQTMVVVQEAQVALSPLEKLRRLERDIAELVHQRKVLLRRNHEIESELSMSANDDDVQTTTTTVIGSSALDSSSPSSASGQPVDLLSLVCQLELSTLSVPTTNLSSTMKMRIKKMMLDLKEEQEQALELSRPQ